MTISGVDAPSPVRARPALETTTACRRWNALVPSSPLALDQNIEERCVSSVSWYPRPPRILTRLLNITRQVLVYNFAVMMAGVV